MTKKEMQLAYLEAVVSTQVTPNTAAKMLANHPDDYIVLDARLGKLPTTIHGSIFIPLDELEERVHELPKDKTIITFGWNPYCITGKRALITLINHDYTAIEIGGGIQGWVDFGKEVEVLGE